MCLKNDKSDQCGSKRRTERLTVSLTQGQGVWSNTTVDCKRDFGGPFLEQTNGFDAVTAFREQSVELLTVRVSSDILKRSG